MPLMPLAKVLLKNLCISNNLLADLNQSVNTHFQIPIDCHL